MSSVAVRSVSDGVGQLVIDHPPLNILTRSVLADLRQQLELVGADHCSEINRADVHGKTLFRRR